MQIRVIAHFIYCYHSTMNVDLEDKNILLIFGGRSCEHAVSVSSARSLIAALGDVPYQIQLLGITEQGGWRWAQDGQFDSLIDGEVVGSSAGVPVLPDLNHPGRFINAQNGSDLGVSIDVIFPLLHGPYGEDGTIQGLFDLYGVPYVGCGVLASACGMDKLYSKILFARAGIAQADYQEVRALDWVHNPGDVMDRVQQELHFPMFVKPARMGSSVGISRVDSVDGLKQAIEYALQFDHKVMIENGFEGMLEVECAILGNAQPQASVVGEIRAAAGFYDYQSKYVDDSSEVIIPAPISDAVSTRVQILAIKAFQALDGSGLARADFFVDPQTDEVWINEVNTLPGFTPISMYPKLWAASGLPYPQLVAKLIGLAIEQFEARSALKCSYSVP